MSPTMLKKMRARAGAVPHDDLMAIISLTATHSDSYVVGIESQMAFATPMIAARRAEAKPVLPRAFQE